VFVRQKHMHAILFYFFLSFPFLPCMLSGQVNLGIEVENRRKIKDVIREKEEKLLARILHSSICEQASSGSGSMCETILALIETFLSVVEFVSASSLSWYDASSI